MEWELNNNLARELGRYQVRDFKTKKIICELSTWLGVEQNSKLIESAPNMLNSLQETDKSISLLKGCLVKLTDDTIELEDILDNWKDRNKEVINKALGQNK